jgi:hypothetical protein
VFGQQSVEFLGHQVSAAGILQLPGRLAAIRQFPRPTTVRGLQAFLGLFNFYRRFVPATAAILRPLTDALAGSPHGSAAVAWDSGHLAAFEAAREALASTALRPDAVGDQRLDNTCWRSASATAVGSGLAEAVCRRGPLQRL